MSNTIRKMSFEGIMMYLLALLIILSGSSMYLVLQGIHRDGTAGRIVRLAAVFIAAVLILYHIIRNRPVIRKNQLLLVAWFIIYYMTYIVFEHFNYQYSIERVMLPVTVFIVLCCVRDGSTFFKGFMNCYTDLVFAMAIVSLVLYVLGPLTEIVPGTTITFWNNAKWNEGIGYYYLLFYNKVQMADFLGQRFIRNIGPFMEAPGFAFPLILSLYWELHMREEKHIRKLRVIFLTAAAVTTFSTKAILLIIFCFTWFLMTRFKDRLHIWRQIKIVVVPLVLVIGILAAGYILYEKTTVKYGAGSVLRRVDDTYAAFMTWMENIIFGTGFNNTTRLFANYMNTRTYGSSTAGLLNVLAYGGLYMMFMYVLSFCGILKNYITAKRSDINGFLILYILFFAVSSIEYNLFTLLLIGIGCSLFFPKKAEVHR